MMNQKKIETSGYYNHILYLIIKKNKLFNNLTKDMTKNSYYLTNTVYSLCITNNKIINLPVVSKKN